MEGGMSLVREEEREEDMSVVREEEREEGMSLVRERGRARGMSLGKPSIGEGITSVLVAYDSEVVESACVSNNGRDWKRGLGNDPLRECSSEECSSGCKGSIVYVCLDESDSLI